MSEQADEFVMPAAEIGDVVLHWQGAESKQACPAVVLLVAERVLTLKVLTHTRDTVIRTGVPHKDDPDRHARLQDPSGFWDHRPAHKNLLSQLAALKSLATRPRG